MKSKLLGLLTIILLIAATAVASAAEPPGSITKTNGDVVVAKGQTVKDATAVNGGVTIYGHVTGDAKAVNGDVRVRSGGVIDGDATAINGNVVKDGGGTVRGSILSKNGRGVDHWGSFKTETHGDVVVEKGQTVNEVSTVKGDITVYGHVTRDATAVMGTVDVHSGGKVDGDATAVMGDVRVRNGGKVSGDATAVMGCVVHEIDGTIGGSTTSLGFPIPKWLIGGYGDMRGLAFFAIVWAVILLLQIVVAAAVVALFPGRMQVIADCVVGQPGWSLLYGLIGLVAAIPVAVLLLITCVGIPFIAVEVLLLFAMWVAGSVGVKLALGQKIRRFESPVWAVIVGTVLLGLVRAIPIAGDLIVSILVVFGVGAVIMTGFGSAPDWFSRRVAKTPPPPPPPGPTQGTGNPGADSAPGTAATP